MEIVQSFVPFVDRYKKSPDLNIRQFEYKTSKTTIFFTLGFWVLLIMVNFTDIQSIWKDTNNLLVETSGDVLSQTSISDFMLGLYFSTSCYEYAGFAPYFTVLDLNGNTYNQTQCSPTILAVYAYDDDASCYLCFNMTGVTVSNVLSNAFIINYNWYNNTLIQSPSSSYAIIIEHDTLDLDSRTIIDSNSQQVIPIQSNQISGFTTTNLVQCKVLSIDLDNLLIDWAPPVQYSYFTQCVSYIGYSKYSDMFQRIMVSRIIFQKYYRQKISIILSNIVSFSFITAVLAWWLSSYNSMLIKMDIAKEVLAVEDQKLFQIHYFDFVLIKTLKIDFIRELFEKYFPTSRHLQLYYVVRQTNKMMSIENVLIPIEQMYREITEQNQQKVPSLNEDNIFVLDGQKQLSNADKLIQQIRSPVDQVIYFQTQFHRNPPKAFLTRLLEVFDIFGYPIELEEEETEATSFFSVCVFLSALVILIMIIYLTGLINSISPSDTTYTVSSASDTAIFNPSVFSIYIVAFDTDLQMPADMNTLLTSTNFSIGIYDTSDIYRRPINLTTNCTLPSDLTTSESFIITNISSAHYCLRQSFTLSQTFNWAEKIKINIFSPTTAFNYNYFTFIRYNYYDISSGNIGINWEVSSYYIAGNTNLAYSQNVYIVKQQIQESRLFSQYLGQYSFNVEDQLSSETSTITSPYVYSLDMNFILSSRKLLVMQPDQAFFNVIINILGINYFLFLFIAKCLNQSFNKQKALKSMSKTLGITREHPSDSYVLYQNVTALGLADPESYEDLEQHRTITMLKGKQFQILNMISLMKTKFKLEYFHRMDVKFGYIKRKLNVREVLFDQEKQVHED